MHRWLKEMRCYEGDAKFKVVVNCKGILSRKSNFQGGTLSKKRNFQGDEVKVL